ncbi:MAG: CrcB family protein [Ilumatobacter sp.]|uniref:fluoride efflux transporter FluC n=1 Tax=Ilumatobacter sp. TaxID=1967498 RepID=UPI0032986634
MAIDDSDPAGRGGRATLAAAAGGVVGAGARWLVGELVTDAGASGLPWATLTVNVLGCLLLGVLVTRFERGSIAWTLLATGVLGGFTTMSAFAIELNGFADDGRTTALVVYLAITIAGGVGALVLGERVGTKSMRTRP